MNKRMPRVGIYSGAFDPVHAGHIAFALQAMKAARLDKVYFVPERRPRHKRGVEHFGHRVAMLKQAIRPHPKFGVLELVDVSFSVERTLPRLKRQFSDSQLVFLLGSDSAKTVPDWPNSERLLATAELVVGVREGDDPMAAEAMIAAWPVQPQALTIFESYAPDVSSGTVREALRHRRSARGLLASVARYSNKHWLYVSLGESV